MPGKNVSVTVRMTQGDAEFVSSLNIDGATTPSEKIRALIRDARFQDERPNDYGDRLNEFERMIQPIIDQVKIQEHETGQHSELISLFAEWLPEAVAEFLTTSRDAEGTSEQSEVIEEIIADRIARLFERALRVMVVPGRSLYNPNKVEDRMKTSLDLSLIHISEPTRPY